MIGRRARRIWEITWTMKTKSGAKSHMRPPGSDFSPTTVLVIRLVEDTPGAATRVLTLDPLLDSLECRARVKMMLASLEFW